MEDMLTESVNMDYNGKNDYIENEDHISYNKLNNGVSMETSGKKLYDQTKESEYN